MLEHGGRLRQAARQHGIVARGQLLHLGLDSAAISRRVARGRLHPVHAGVYAVGHASLTLRARWMAAVLRGGRHAVLSHRAAGALWQVVAPSSGPIDVTVATGRAAPPGLRFHCLPIGEDERTIVDGIPVTCPARTLCDLARSFDEQGLARAVHEAEVRRLGGALSMPDVLARYPGRHGSGTARRVLGRRAQPAGITSNAFEAGFLDLVKAAGLPTPRVRPELRVGGRKLEPDFVWDDARVIVETDGREVHLTADAFERDRARDRMLQAHGWRVVRVTWRQARFEGAAVASDLRRLLGCAP